MWARVFEVSLGCWLVMSPFIFAHSDEATFYWWSDMITGAVVIAIALFSYWPPLEKIHLAQLAVAAWLVGHGFLQGYGPLPPADQNHVSVGLLLLMFGLIPSHADQPPKPWREHYEKQAGERLPWDP